MLGLVVGMRKAAERPLVRILVLLYPISSGAEPCEKMFACRKLLASAQKHVAYRNLSAAQLAYEQALAISQDGTLLRPLSDVLVAQRKTDEAFRLYQDHLSGLATKDPSREVRSRELVHLLSRPEMRASEASEELQAPTPPDLAVTSVLPASIVAPHLRSAFSFALPHTEGEMQARLDCAPAKQQNVLRYGGATLFGLGVGGIISGGIFQALNGTENGRTCERDGASVLCGWNTGMGSSISYGLGGGGALLGGVLFGLSFLPERGTSCVVSK